MRHFVYITMDRKSGRFYIGKHSALKDFGSYSGSGVWVKQCKANGRELFTRPVAEFSSCAGAFEFERRAIALFRDTERCMNFADGGEGQTSEFLRRVLSRPGVRAKLRAASSRSSGNLGKTWALSEISKENHRISTKRAWEEGRMKGATGYRHTELAKLKIGLRFKGRTFSEETRRRMSVAAKTRAAREGRTTSDFKGFWAARNYK